jgi:hypothetical protein
MLDRASLHALARHPERNDPILNVALAEEGDYKVLLALAECVGVGPETLSRIAARIEAEGDRVGHTEDPEGEDLSTRSRRTDDVERGQGNGSELDRRLVVHPQSDDQVREAILARHDDDPFFALAAAAHCAATERSIERVIQWPSLTPLHDRSWLGLIDSRAVSPMTFATWATDDDELVREAVARLSDDSSLLERLGHDPARRVRRAIAGNSSALRATLDHLLSDPACEVRARAAAREAHAQEPAEPVAGARGVEVTSARFKAAVGAMRAGGTVAADVIRALRSGPLDEEGARLAARALDDAVVAELVGSGSRAREVDLAFAAGIAFRNLEDAEDHGAGLLAHCAHALADSDRTGSLLTGKGRLARWLAEGVTRAAEQAPGELIDALGARTLAADRMVLGSVVSGSAAASERFAKICEDALGSASPLPTALLEAAWRDAGVPDEAVARLAARVGPIGTDGSLEQEVDLDPRSRPLALLERIGVALVGKTPLSPRAALALVALEPRRVRYILSALPQWKGVLSGANVARVLKAHAGALSAAGPSAHKRPTQAAASWTQRRLDEVELAVALAVRDISPDEALKRILAGYASPTQGPPLAAGLEARATLDGTSSVEPLLEYLARERARDGAVLASWLLVEGLDRVRSPTAIAAALDASWVAPSGALGSSSRSMVPPGLSEALATLERRSPGRLAAAMPQTPRGRAALASGIARAYRALGGMAVMESSS